MAESDSSRSADRPGDAEFRAALQHHRMGDFHRAASLYKSAVDQNPDHADAWHLLGALRLQTGGYAEAAEHIGRSLSLNPHNAAAHSNLGTALRQLGRLDDALACYDRAVAIRPDFVDALYNRGNALRAKRLHDEALKSYDAALANGSNLIGAHINRGHTLRELNRHAEAIESYDRALAISPVSTEALLNRGNALKDLGRLEESLASYNLAVASRPDDPRSLTGQGNALAELGRIADAMDSYTRALSVDANSAEARNNRGLLQLLLGRFHEGWKDCESRWLLDSPLSLRPIVDAPTWSGEPIAGRRILVYNEQGLGDTIQFVRYLPLLAKRGAEVTFFCPTKLVRLLGSLPAPIRFVNSVSEHDRFDFQCALLSLPMIFATEISNVPNDVPYLFAEPALVDTWRARIGERGLKVGICWQGNNAGRAIPLRSFAPLAQRPGVRLIAIQKGEGLRQLHDLPHDVTVETLGDDFDSGPDAFVDTAAVIETLDLVITADTSLAHVGGALGRPVWIALRSVPDWRWMLDRSDSPWYPTVRLFRQTFAGDWDRVFADIARHLGTPTGASR